MRSSYLSIALLVMFSSSPVFAMDLLDSWHAAQAKDPQFSAARAGAEAGRTKNDQARALNLPQVTMSAGTGVLNAYNKISDAQFSAPGMGSASGANFRTKTDQGADLRWNLRAEQSIYNAERSTLAHQLASQAQLAEVKLSAEEQMLILRVSKAYFDVLLAEDTLASIKAQKVAVSRALKTAQARFAEGDVAIIDTREAQARHDALVSQELEAEANYQLASAALADLTGDSGHTLARLPEQMDLQQFNAGELNDWISLAQTNSPYLSMQKIQQNIAHDEINKFSASSSPILNLVASAGGEELRGIGGANNSELSNHNLGVGLQLVIPLYTGGMRNAKHEEAIALAEQAKDETEVVRLRAAQEARTAWLGVTTGKGRVSALEQAVLSSQTRLDATQLGREVGDRTTLDVLHAEQDYFARKTELFRARYQMLLSMLGLAASAGTLDEKRLMEVNSVLVAKQSD